MNILFIVGWPLGQGGHINSTYNLIRDITKIEKNSDISLIAPDGEKSIYFKNLEISFKPFRYSKNKLIFFCRLTLNIISVCLDKKIDIIHVMDYKSLVYVIFINLILRKKIVFTKAGGKPIQTRLPKISSFIIFSVELNNFYNRNKNLSPGSPIILIKERIDTSLTPIKFNKKDIDHFVVFIAMRLQNEKKQLLENLFLDLDKLRNPKKIKIIIAGSGSLLCYFKSKANKLKNKIKFIFLGEINDKQKILHYNLSSDLIVGHGRGIMEAMVQKKPVVLLAFDRQGSQLVSSSNINNISNYNFSGRNFIFGNEDYSLTDILNKKNRKLFLKDYSKFNRDYILKEYDSIIGAKKTIDVYKNSFNYNFDTFLNNFYWILNKIV